MQETQLYTKEISENGRVRYVPHSKSFDLLYFKRGYHLLAVGENCQSIRYDIKPDTAAAYAGLMNILKRASEDKNLIAAYTRPDPEPLTPRQAKLWEELREMNRGRFIVITESLMGFLDNLTNEVLR